MCVKIFHKYAMLLLTEACARIAGNVRIGAPAHRRRGNDFARNVVGKAQNQVPCRDTGKGDARISVTAIGTSDGRLFGGDSEFAVVTQPAPCGWGLGKARRIELLREILRWRRGPA
jgi:hypothetical protein